MPIFEVECLAKVRKIYVIEAPDAATASDTASFNPPVDEYEVETSVVSVTEKSGVGITDEMVEARQILTGLQWSGGYDSHERPLCPWCQRYEEQGHGPDCRLAALAAAPTSDGGGE